MIDQNVKSSTGPANPNSMDPKHGTSDSNEIVNAEDQNQVVNAQPVEEFISNYINVGTDHNTGNNAGENKADAEANSTNTQQHGAQADDIKVDADGDNFSDDIPLE